MESIFRMQIHEQVTAVHPGSFDLAALALFFQ